MNYYMKQLYTYLGPQANAQVLRAGVAISGVKRGAQTGTLTPGNPDGIPIPGGRSRRRKVCLYGQSHVKWLHY